LQSMPTLKNQDLNRIRRVMAVKLSSGQLRGIIARVTGERTRPQSLSEAFSRTLRRLDELYDGSAVGSHLKQAVTKLWEADNLVQQAMGEAETSAEQKVLSEMHETIESLAFKIDWKMHHLTSGDVNKRSAPRKVPQAPKRNR